MTVKIKVLVGHHFFLAELRHPIAHPFADVDDHRLILRVQFSEEPSHLVKLLHQEAIVVSITDSGEIRFAIHHVNMESAKHRISLLQFDGHVILNRIQPSQHEVEHTNRILHLGWKLLDHSCEGS